VPGASGRIVEEGGSACGALRRCCAAWRLSGALVLAVALLAGAAPVALAAEHPTARRAAPVATGFRVVAVTPHPGSGAADGALDVVVRMSGPLAAASPRPGLSPHLAGRWVVSGASFVFTPEGAFAPGTRVTVTVPGGRTGVVDAAGHHLARTAAFAYTVGSLGVIRAEQILAQLGWLPVRFEPAVRGPLDDDALAKAAFDPPAGRFVWWWKAPASLRALWTPGRPGLVLTGAIMSFQAKLGLPVSGVLDPPTTEALLEAARHPAPAVDHMGYRYALAVESDPETFSLYDNGRVVVASPANTGIPQAPTSIGTYPVYLRLATQIMKGTEPDGQPYADPVAWVAYFDAGEAVHYIARYYYGYPQSLGCVELPWDAAEEAWPMLGIGTLVTVEG